MRIFDTMVGKKVDFVPREEGKVSMYLCGPTVYDLGHLGHGRSAVAFDVIRRYFLYKGLEVDFVSNYTDIDDKMIERARIAKVEVKELAKRIIPEYERDYGSLNVMKASSNPKATDFIKEIIEIIEGLEKKDMAYKISDGIYFDVSKFEDYGKLSKQDLNKLRSGVRVDLNNEKRTPFDFVLWKFYKEGEPFWESPWGKGRPGWHIECSAMSRKLLGPTFDIHGGGADLVFPHHECEIAQSEGCYDEQFAKYWMYNGFIEVNKEKMSKSLGNFFTLRDIFEEFSPLAVRLLFLQTHYKAPIEFNREILGQAENGLDRVKTFMRRIRDFQGESGEISDECKLLVVETEKRFVEAMEEDFETPQAMAAFFDLIKSVNKMIDEHLLGSEEKELIMDLLNRLNSVIGILDEDEEDEIDGDLEKMINLREKARKDKNWAEADRIRDELLEKGVELEDTASGTVWKKVK